MVLIFFTIMFLLVGFILISVGVWAKEYIHNETINDSTLTIPLLGLKKEATAYLGQ